MKAHPLFAALLITGCSGAGPTQGPDLSNEPPWVEVGTGWESFIPVAEGDGVPLIRGPQGGFHLWTSVRVSRHFDPEKVEVTTWAEGGLPPGYDHLPARLTLQPFADGYERLGLRAFIYNETLIGQTVTLKVEVVDSTGRKGSDERTVVITDR